MSSPPILFEPATSRHCRQIIDLILPIQQIEFNVPVTLEAQPDLLDIETHYHAGGGGFWIARHADPDTLSRHPDPLNPAGPSGQTPGLAGPYPILGSIGLLSIGHQAGAIRKMFVRKEYRGKELGIAQRLLETLLAYSLQNGITDLYLGTVEQLKAAQRFYERNGFRKIDKKDLPVYFPVMAVDTLFYHIHLPG